MYRPKHHRPRGILNLGMAERATAHHRYWPSDDLAGFVDHYWAAEWDLAEPVRIQTIPHPLIYLIIENGTAVISGVSRSRFVRVLEGRNMVFAVRFRSGAFRAFLSRPVSVLTHRILPLRELFGAAAAPLEGLELSVEGLAETIGKVENFLRGCQPQPDEQAHFVATITARIAEDRSLVRVEQLVQAYGLAPRQLQRLFLGYIGVSPKWVIQRYRLHEAAERLAAGGGDSLDIAHDLGYADQAHFIRDFKRWVGRSPMEYARGLEGP